LSKAEYRQLPFAFADSPQGDGPAKLSDVSVGKAWLSLKAKGKEGKDSVAWTVDPVRLLESVASVSNLAQALLNVARNKGAAPVPPSLGPWRPWRTGGENCLPTTGHLAPQRQLWATQSVSQ
jgi:hypothetical protein